MQCTICDRTKLQVRFKFNEGVTFKCFYCTGVRTLTALARHSNMATTQRYIDLRPAVIKAAVKLVYVSLYKDILRV
jgi:hypothetical protein